MKVEFEKGFHKIFRKRFSHITSVQNKFKERTRLFSKDHQNPVLHDHQLVGTKKHMRSFAITGDIRVLYYVKNDIAYFVDIGTHNQVYT